MINIFDWLGDFVGDIGESISTSFEEIGVEISNAIWDTMLQWFYEIIYNAVAEFFTMMQLSILYLHSRNFIGQKGERKLKRKRRGKSVQNLLAIKTFTKHGLSVGKEELLFFNVQPTNISVLSNANIEIKIRHLMMVLSAVPDIEISCTDSSECFDNNKSYQKGVSLFR